MQINNYFTCFLSFLIFSCTSENNIRTYGLQKTNVTKEVKLKESKVQESKGLSWVKPDSWIPSEGSSMRLASFSVPYSKGIGDLSVIKLSGSGGGLESNVNRWRRQLDLEPQTLEEIKATSIMGSSMIGNFSVYKLINDELNQAFLCAILPYADSTIFIKLNSSIITANALEKKFLDFCSSFKSSK